MITSLMPQYTAFVFCIGMHSSTTIIYIIFIYVLLDIGAPFASERHRIINNSEFRTDKNL